MTPFPWCIHIIVHLVKIMKTIYNATLLFLMSYTWKLCFLRERAEALGLEGHLWSHTAIKRKLFLEIGGCRAEALGKAQERKREGGVGLQTQAGRERNSSLALGLGSFPGCRPGSTAAG
ncbi:uncharacterized protein LOC104679141 [Rhinopithecus roxellana]|uniref:uncharacterized protein LOC104679141 n=1 Tax=Rhinopithecus roxellana TaxID=61622 RepID=UPI0012370C87|nr:uncharacterized protein LOC104679141 [Rhinopithecus roxellana]